MPCLKLLAGYIFEDNTHLIYAKYMPSTLHKYEGDKRLYPEIHVSTYFMPLAVPPLERGNIFPAQALQAVTAEIKAVCAGLTHWGTEHKGGHTAAAELGGG